jgi:agmatinase
MRPTGTLDYIRHGQTPMFRLPVALGPDDKGWEEARAVFLGVPYDSGTTYQPGARFAPYTVRRLSAILTPYHPDLDRDLFAAASAVDGGNIPVTPFNSAEMRELVEQGVRQVTEADKTPLVVGGDHSISLPILRAVADRHGPLALVHFDAHFDLSEDAVSGEDFYHGTPIRHVIEERLIAPGKLVHIGQRCPWQHRDEARLSRDHGGRLHLAGELLHRSVNELVAEVVAVVGESPLYISFDVDAIDPAFAPGTGTPVPGGISSREAFALIRGLDGSNLAGADVVEISPPLDHNDTTSLVGAHLLYELLALVGGGFR